MGHAIQVFIASNQILGSATKSYKYARVIPLPQDFSLLPLTQEFTNELGKSEKVFKPYKEFWQLTDSLKKFGKSLSEHGFISYIETDYFGGRGEQAAIVWSIESIVLGPLRSEEIGPINSVLKIMGVKADEYDEFSALELHTHRSNERWIEANFT
jgi:hypothetical protein